LKAFLLISILSCCLNLDANGLAAFCKVAAKSFLIVRADNDDEVLVAKLPLDLLNEIEDSWNQCSFELVGMTSDFVPFGELANSVKSVLITVVTLFSLRH
jgi:hypothetical protein